MKTHEQIEAELEAIMAVPSDPRIPDRMAAYIRTLSADELAYENEYQQRRLTRATTAARNEV